MSTELRKEIIEYMSRPPKSEFDRGWHPTWWFKHHVFGTTAVIRKELEQMERDGLVESDHRLSNQTNWHLKSVE